MKPLPLASTTLIHGLLVFFSLPFPPSKVTELTHHGRAHTIQLKRQSPSEKAPTLKHEIKSRKERTQQQKQTQEPKILEEQGEETLQSGVEDQLSEYITEVRSIIERQKFYPRQARRLAHQGELELLVSIDEQGEIVEIKVLNSTNSRLLDRAGLEIFEHIQRFPPFPNDAPVPLIEVNITLNYRM